MLKLIHQLFTFHVVLLKLRENFFNNAFYDKHIHMFTPASNALKEISRVANILIDEYLPTRSLTKTRMIFTHRGSGQRRPRIMH